MLAPILTRTLPEGAGTASHTHNTHTHTHSLSLSHSLTHSLSQPEEGASAASAARRSALDHGRVRALARRQRQFRGVVKYGR